MTQRLMNWLAQHLSTMFYNMAAILMSWCYNNNTKPEEGDNDDITTEPEVEEGPKIKILKRQRTTSSFLRHRTAEYIDYLEGGKSGKISQWLWKTYTRYVPDYYRNVDTESARNDPLPLWLEQIIEQLEKRSVKRALFLCLLVTLLVLSSHLWLPYLGFYAGYGNTVKGEIHLILNREMDECTNSSSLSEYCFLRDTNDRSLINDVLKMTESSIDKPSSSLKHHHREGLNLIMDAEQLIYYPVLFPTPLAPPDALSNFLVFPYGENTEQYQWTTQYVRTELELNTLLTRIHTEETKRGIVSERPCICPSFVRIEANMSFYLDTSEQRWIVMLEPVIHRNNTFAELVSSTVSLNAQSLFYNKPGSTATDMIHYDSFVIEYLELSSKQLMLDDKEIIATQLGKFNTKLKDAGFEEARIYYRMNEAPLQEQRKKMHVSGDDAICFIYCNTIR